jgi:hypothetical protein
VQLEEFKKKKAAKAGAIPVTTTATTAVAEAPSVAAPAPKPPAVDVDDSKAAAAPGATSRVSDTVEVRARRATDWLDSPLALQGLLTDEKVYTSTRCWTCAAPKHTQQATLSHDAC